MLGWTGLQIVLALGALAMLYAAAGRQGPATWLGYGISWVPLGKLAAYVILGGILFTPSVRAFLYLKGGGELSKNKPRKEMPDQFVFDPDSPVPTHGGAVCCNPKVFPWGPMDQRLVESRRDVLVYTDVFSIT